MLAPFFRSAIIVTSIEQSGVDMSQFLDKLVISTRHRESVARSLAHLLARLVISSTAEKKKEKESSGLT